MKASTVLDETYLLETFSDKVASDWLDLGIELEVENLDNHKTFADPTKIMYKNMLKEWLQKQTGTKADILKRFYEAMIKIGLIADAEKFKDKARKVFKVDWP